MKKFDISIFLNEFYQSTNSNLSLKKIWICLKFIYGLNIYSAVQICFLFGINISVLNKFLTLNDWTSLFGYFKLNFNFSIYDIKLINIKNIRTVRSYKGWRHIFNLPVNGQRSHTNAKTRKKYKVY